MSLEELAEADHARYRGKILAVPGQLDDGEYVSWVHGPTYYEGGGRVTPTWFGEPRDRTIHENRCSLSEVMNG